MSAARRVGFILAASALLAVSACKKEGPSAPPATTESPASAPATERVVGPLNPADAAALATMTERLKAYVNLHTTIEKSLPALSKDSTQAQIVRHQRMFEDKMRKARATAKPGEIFVPEARPVIKRLLATVFGGPDGGKLKASIMDENPADPVALQLAVNGRYPDTVPLTTIPPQVLQTLPELTEDLEYRFVGDWLILLDTHAHVIADFIDNALPK